MFRANSPSISRTKFSPLINKPVVIIPSKVSKTFKQVQCQFLDTPGHLLAHQFIEKMGTTAQFIVFTVFTSRDVGCTGEF